MGPLIADYMIKKLPLLYIKKRLAEVITYYDTLIVTKNWRLIDLLALSWPSIDINDTANLRRVV